MGTWGWGTFENDGAHEWLADLMENQDGPGFVRSTLESARAAGPLVGRAPHGVLAAAELVALAGGAEATERIPDVASDWLRLNAPAIRDLSETAIEAVQRIAVQSELREIMDETGPDALTALLSQLDTLLARVRKKS